MRRGVSYLLCSSPSLALRQGRLALISPTTPKIAGTTSKISLISYSKLAYSTAATEYRNNPFETDLSAFHNVAQDTLHQIVTAVEAVEGDIEIPEFDIKETDGVCEIKVGSKGTYVLNKQTPNRQIWFSSPISGPKRFNYDATVSSWRNTRDGQDLLALLEKELSQLIGAKIEIKRGSH